MTRGAAQCGFTLVEVVITTALFCALTGTLLAVLQPARDLFAVQPEMQDVQQRLRYGVETLQRDLEAAGHRAFAAVMPYRIGDRRSDVPSGIFYRPDVLTVVAIAQTAVPARIRSLSAAGASVLVDVESNCQGTTGVCGFGEGTRVAAFDDGAHVWFGTVALVDGHLLQIESTSPDFELQVPGATLVAVDISVYARGVDAASGIPRLLRYDGHVTELPVVDDVVKLSFEYEGDPQPPALIADGSDPLVVSATYGPRPPAPNVNDPSDTWPAGQNCTFALADEQWVPRLATLATGRAPVLLSSAMLTDGPWCPDESSPNRFDADLLRVRVVHVVLRVQAAYPWLRGSGPLFMMPGTGRARMRLVPDQEISFAVSPRNLVSR